jgi:CheY-like chemotaxis protein
LKKNTVLLVEDSKVQKLAYERILHKAGHLVINAGDGEEAVRVAQEESPDLILLDMLLPKLSGPEVLHALKQDPTTARIPVMVLSGLPQCNEAKLRFEGAASYFEKSRLVDSVSGERLFLEMIFESAQQVERDQGIGGRNLAWRNVMGKGMGHQPETHFDRQA